MIDPVGRRREPGCCELVTTCQIVEIAKRIVKATIHFFVVLVNDLYQTMAWVCHRLYDCIAWLCCEAEEAAPRPPTSPVQTRVENLFDRQFPKSAEEEPILATPLVTTPILKQKVEERNELARIKEFQDAVATTLSSLKTDIPTALMTLAEIETETPKGTLRNAPYGVLQSLKETPVRVLDIVYKDGCRVLEMIPNPERARIWPVGRKAADKLAELQKGSPDPSLLRLAQIQTLERLFQIKDTALKFDLDLALEKYNKKSCTKALREWFDFVHPPVSTPLFFVRYRSEEEEWKELQNPQRLYNDALADYEIGTGQKAKDPLTGEDTEVGLLVTECLSNIHDILTRKRASTIEGSMEEKELKNLVQAFIEIMIDANNNCADQMISQLEGHILRLLADELPDSLKTPLDKFGFKMSLALMHYRATLVKAFIQRLYPNQNHTADLEREVKRILAKDLGLKGKIFTVKAKYEGLTRDVKEKAKEVKDAVLNAYHPLLFLMDHFANNDHQFDSMHSLRSDIINHVNGLVGIDHFNEEEGESSRDPLTVSLSAIDEDWKRANYGGPLTFEGVLFYLETAGILIRR